jgi:hypothetical protein
MSVPMNNAADLRSPGTSNGSGLLRNARNTLGAVSQRTDSLVRGRSDSLANGLGWFSVGLGLAQLTMPDRVARLAGIEPTETNCRLMRTMGMRELSSGVGILTQPVPDKWLWGRVVGDVLDLAMLGVALGNGKGDRGRALGATLAVLGVTGLDLLAARELSREREAAVEDGAEIGARSLFRIVTIKAHPANVEKDWAEWVATRGSDESREATVTFRAAPGTQGTEMRADLTYTPKGGKIGSAAQRMMHKSPGQMLGQDLKRFKMTVETGEVVKSDASIHERMHPARPDDTLANANLMMEEAR